MRSTTKFVYEIEDLWWQIRLNFCQLNDKMICQLMMTEWIVHVNWYRQLNLPTGRQRNLSTEWQYFVNWLMKTMNYTCRLISSTQFVNWILSTGRQHNLSTKLSLASWGIWRQKRGSVSSMATYTGALRESFYERRTLPRNFYWKQNHIHV